MAGIAGVTQTTVHAVRDALARIARDHFPVDPDGSITEAIGTTLRMANKSEVAAILAPYPQSDGVVFSTLNQSGDVFDPKTLKRFRSGENIRPINFFYIYIFIRLSYNSSLPSTEEEVAMASGGPIVSAVRTVFNHTRPVLVADAERFRGRYELIRPFPYDPAKYLAARLSVGVGSANGQRLRPFDCALAYEYENAGASKKPELTGKLVMHGSSATLFMSNPDQAHFIFYVDHRDSRGATESMAGILMADTGGKDLASAWPFHARWLPEGEVARSGVLTVDQLDPAIMRHLKRGHIEWDPTRLAL